MKIRLIDHLATDHFGNIEPGSVLDIQSELAIHLVAVGAAVFDGPQVVAVEESAAVDVTPALVYVRPRRRGHKEEEPESDGERETESGTGGE